MAPNILGNPSVEAPLTQKHFRQNVLPCSYPWTTVAPQHSKRILHRNLIVFPHAPYRIVNAVGACLAGADAVCMALLAVSVLEWEGTENAKRADNAVMIIELVALVGGLPGLDIVTVVVSCYKFCPPTMYRMYTFQSI